MVKKCKNSKETSPSVTAKAAKQLKNPKTPKIQRSVAGSALSQAHLKKCKLKKAKP